jgi:hypothetical protein
MHDVRGMVALGIESGGKREHMSGTKLDTESASFAALDDDGNTAFCHGNSTLKVVEETMESEVIMPGRGRRWCDRDHTCT